jgi:hypothetical protein
MHPWSGIKLLFFTFMSTILETLSQALRGCPAGHAASVQHPQMHIQSISEYAAQRLLGHLG